MRLSIAVCVVVVLLGGFIEGQRGEQETWVNTGIGPGSPTDIQKFIRSTDAAFVGVLEQVSVKFVDDNQRWLFTSMRFRVSEWLYNATKQNDTVIDVLTIGGSFTERGGQRSPKQPNEIAGHLRIGAEYFVPVKYAKDATAAWNGRPVVAGLDALTELRDGQVLTVQPHARWAENILSKTATTQGVPGAPNSARARLISAMKSDGVGK